MFNARNQYDERPVLASDLSFEGDPGVTKQSDLKETDINFLFKRFEKTGQLPDLIVKNGHYGDYSSVPDYQQALDIVRLAEEQFSNLDVDLRNRFENDPAKFLDFASNPVNARELRKMGLLNSEAIARLDAEDAAITAQANAEYNAKKLADEQALIAKIKAELNK